MGVAVRSRAFPQRREQTGPTLHRGAALGLKHGGSRGAEFGSEAKPKPTASGVQARFWMSSHQGCWEGAHCACPKLETGPLIRGGCSLRSRPDSPGAGTACSSPPRNIPSGSYSRGTSCDTHTQRKTKESLSQDRTLS